MFIEKFCCSLLLIILAIPAMSNDSGKFDAVILGSDHSFASFSSVLENAGYNVSFINEDTIGKNGAIDEKIDLLFIPNAANLPVDTVKPITDAMLKGVDIIALNAPMWGNSIINTHNGKMRADDYYKEISYADSTHRIMNFSPDVVSSLGRGSNDMNARMSYKSEIIESLPNSNMLHVSIDDLQGWETLGTGLINDPFPNGNTLTVFTAKGSATTSQGYIEWVEKDGSRWVAVFPLYNEWRKYVLTPDNFNYWQSNPARGYKGDKFNPANAERFAVGLSFSFTGWDPGKHEYSIGPVATDKMNDIYRQLIASSSMPVADALSPYYKFFDITNAASLKCNNNDISLPMPASVRSSHPRPRGVGFNKNREWRWFPIVESFKKDGKWCGNPAVMLINSDGKYKNGKWASFAINDLNWYNLPEVRNLLTDTALNMKRSIYLVDAGAGSFTYFSDQTIKLGARIANMDSKPADISVIQKLTDISTGKIVTEKTWNINITDNSVSSIDAEWKPDRLYKKGFIVNTDLIINGKSVDNISHDISIYTPKKNPKFVKIKDGEFILKGKPWRPNGVNYMPSSGIAMEDGVIFGSWFNVKAYDPKVIERDIENMRSMGLNAVSIFLFYDDLKSQNLLDFLYRLDKYGMKANLSLRPGTPMDFPWEMTKEMIEFNRLKDNDTVFAYDLAWEPMFGSQADRSYWDSEWQRWVIERYGSIVNAERDWNFPIPRKTDGTVTNPLPMHISSDGEWRVMMAAYRRFLDTLLYKKYGAARDLVHSIDPNHHVSFRMAEASNPQYSWGENIPYDFAYLSSAVDFLSPEAYGRIGTWERVKPGWFQREYAKMLAPEKPMIWAEMGVSIWDTGQKRTSEKLMNFQGDVFDAFYKMMKLSGANGIFSWYFPGGYRYDERSDYGILNPDTSFRRTSQVIKEKGNFYKQAEENRIYFDIDRDKRAEGFAGVYDELYRKFWAAIDKGLSPRLKTSGMGTTSANCPLLAVGNTKCDGTNPPKYLDGSFDLVEIKDAAGRWIRVNKGDSVNAKIGNYAEIRISIRNLNDAKWLSNSKFGKVAIKFSGDIVKTIDIKKDLARHEKTVVRDSILINNEKSMNLILTFDASERTSFGEKFDFMLVPQ